LLIDWAVDSRLTADRNLQSAVQSTFRSQSAIDNPRPATNRHSAIPIHNPQSVDPHSAIRDPQSS
jgi:hypothetical protein